MPEQNAHHLDGQRTSRVGLASLAEHEGRCSGRGRQGGGGRPQTTGGGQEHRQAQEGGGYGRHHQAGDGLTR